MKKYIKLKLLMMLTICTISAASVFNSGRNTIYAQAYTEDEKAAAKEWLAANGYPPTREGAEQAYQDYLNGKFGPVQGTEAPPASNPSPESNPEAETPEAGAEEQPAEDASTEPEQPVEEPAPAAVVEPQPEPQPKAEPDASASAETEKKTSNTTTNTVKKETSPATEAEKKEVNGAAAAKNDTKETAIVKDDADSEQGNADSALTASASTELTATGTAATAAVNIPEENINRSAYIGIICLVVVGIVIVTGLALVLYLRRKNDQTIS